MFGTLCSVYSILTTEEEHGVLGEESEDYKRRIKVLRNKTLSKG